MDKNDSRKMLGYEEYSPQELLAYSTVPPFKVNFNIPLKKPETISAPHRRPSTVTVSSNDIKDPFKRISKLVEYFMKTLKGHLSE